MRPTLGQIVARFKCESTNCINAIPATPGARIWERGFYDHIIRRGESLDRIRRYITDNPARWAFDRENPQAVRPTREDPWAHT